MISIYRIAREQKTHKGIEYHGPFNAYILAESFNDKELMFRLSLVRNQYVHEIPFPKEPHEDSPSGKVSHFSGHVSACIKEQLFNWLPTSSTWLDMEELGFRLYVCEIEPDRIIMCDSQVVVHSEQFEYKNVIDNPLHFLTTIDVGEFDVNSFYDSHRPSKLLTKDQKDQEVVYFDTENSGRKFAESIANNMYKPEEESNAMGKSNTDGLSTLALMEGLSNGLNSPMWDVNQRLHQPSSKVGSGTKRSKAKQARKANKKRRSKKK